MRIAFVSTILAYPWGGADTLWTRAAEAAADRGDALLLCVSPAVAEAPRIRALEQRGARIARRQAPVPPRGLPARLRRKAASLLRPGDALAAALRDFGPDSVVFSCGGTYDLILEAATWAWLESSRTPYRIVANGQNENPEMPEAERLKAAAILRGAAAVCFVSTRNLENTRRHLGEALPRARVVHNPLRWRAEDRPAWPAGGGWGLATVSRLEPSKGVALLLHALERTLGRVPGWHLDVFGQGPDRTRLEGVAAGLGLAERVRFRGHVPELRSIWEENHLMISPSIEDGVPMTIPEAMLCGRPVLATAVGGAEDWIEAGATGFLCPAPTLPLLAGALQEAWEARLRWREMGEAGARRAASLYRPDDFLGLIEPITP